MLNLRCIFAAALISLAIVRPIYATPPAPGFVEKAEAAIQRHLAASTFSGVVLVAENGKPIFRRAYGLANREWNIATTPTTVFRIASTTKSFTAAAVLKLVDAGEVKLDDPVSTYYRNAPAAWGKVRVRDLLDQTSGIEDFIQANGFIRGPARMQQQPDDLIALVRDKPLRSPPGAQFSYSNTNYVLLGRIISTVTGLQYQDYLRKSILDTLGLHNTAYDNPEDVVEQRASGYWRPSGAWGNARLMTPEVLDAAGALRSTADDLLAWSEALHKGDVISTASRRAMFTDYGHGYGFGSFIENRHGHLEWDNGGNLTGFCSAFEYYPADDVTVIVLDNVEGRDAESLAKELAGLYFDWR